MLLIGGTIAIGCAYVATLAFGAPPPWANWLLALGTASTPVGLFTLGAVTRGVHSRRLALLLGVLFVVLFASFGAALAMAPDEGAGGPLFVGLPVRLAIVFYGVGFVPLLALPMAFAKTFRDDGPDASDSSAKSAS